MPEPLSRVRLVLGDITKLDADAIVTSANAALAGGGGGVDGMVHKAAGPELLKACLDLGGCSTGTACITPGFNLSAKQVIHAVGPIYQGGDKGERDLLTSAYRSSLQLCDSHSIASIAFPCVSTGAYEYPPDEACEIAVETVLSWLQEHDLPREVTFCCYEEDNAQRYAARLGLPIERN